MVVKSVAINAYQNAMLQRRKSVDDKVTKSLVKPQAPVKDFKDTFTDSLKTVNDMQAEKKQMIEEFASGKKQNIHELMISMQKAGLAVQMTGAVRSKLMQSYQEIMRMPF
ncbi:flagellar hook-basal body complex protein FliE [Pseudodesulfovibrio sp. zrk46]|uniref:flagellar hook-basal body complex protein FliE n=1 Tax=Pseudodesulfovibrio sp. zrk46 TaxID=2725288 RepID=UPI001449DD8E|nr:flagellar hook-basal body complex protein FliE [Pseudodesulfovibrio sp. zrk46]QJB57259.1 flagellar hook-basal body complex protein FliE [Pseudodesulfovibrio sp. zrk46]